MRIAVAMLLATPLLVGLAPPDDPLLKDGVWVFEAGSSWIT